MNPHGESYSLLIRSELRIREYEGEGSLIHEI
jgi:hypothetical protein